MTISSVPGQTINNLFNQQGTHATGKSQGTGSTSSTDPSSGVAAQGGVLPPIIAALEHVIQELSATALAPTSGTGTEKAGGHHHHEHSGASGSSKSTDSSSTTGSTDSSSKSKSDQLADASQLINQLWNTTDGTINQLAKIIIMEAADQSREAQQEAVADTEQAKGQLLNQAAAMNKEADQMRDGAAVALVMTVVSSAISIGFAAGTIKMNAESMNMVDKATSKVGTLEGKLENMEGKVGKEAEAVQKDLSTALEQAKKEETVALQQSQNLGNKAQAYGQLGQAASGLVSGFGSFANTMYQADAKDTEAEGDVDAANAQDTQAQAQIAQKVADSMNQLVSQITDLLKEMADADAQMMQSMTRV
jgi:hypothetical protein